MATELKVRHALVTYRPAGAKDGVVEKAFRTSIITVDDEEATRLRALGAVIDADADVPRPGEMMALPEAATDGEVVNWVLAASPSEIEDLIRARPEMSSRIGDAVGAIKATHAEQVRVLEGAARASRRAKSDHEKHAAEAEAAARAATEATEARRAAANDPTAAGRSATTAGATAPQPSVNEPTVPGGVVQPTIQPEDEATVAARNAEADRVVSGNVDEVNDYLGDQPEMGQAILDAEARRATAEGKAPRKGVLEAAATAIEMTTAEPDDDEDRDPAADDPENQTPGA
jgi:hypothetical protein